MLTRFFAGIGLTVVAAILLIIAAYGMPWMRVSWTSYGVPHVWCSYSEGHEDECAVESETDVEEHAA